VCRSILLSFNEPVATTCRALAAAKRYEDAATIAEPAVEAAGQQAQPEFFWRMADQLAFYLQRAGRLEQAMSLWREAIDLVGWSLGL
jgi:predicted RNA polymerase sigma factor